MEPVVTVEQPSSEVPQQPHVEAPRQEAKIWFKPGLFPYRLYTGGRDKIGVLNTMPGDAVTLNFRKGGQGNTLSFFYDKDQGRIKMPEHIRDVPETTPDGVERTDEMNAWVLREGGLGDLFIRKGDSEEQEVPQFQLRTGSGLIPLDKEVTLAFTGFNSDAHSMDFFTTFRGDNIGNLVYTGEVTKPKTMQESIDHLRFLGKRMDYKARVVKEVNGSEASQFEKYPLPPRRTFGEAKAMLELRGRPKKTIKPEEDTTEEAPKTSEAVEVLTKSNFADSLKNRLKQLWPTIALTAALNNPMEIPVQPPLDAKPSFSPIVEQAKQVTQHTYDAAGESFTGHFKYEWAKYTHPELATPPSDPAEMQAWYTKLTEVSDGFQRDHPDQFTNLQQRYRHELEVQNPGIFDPENPDKFARASFKGASIGSILAAPIAGNLQSEMGRQ